MEPRIDIFEQWESERKNKSWIKRKIESIHLWWYHDGRYYHKDFIQGVKNIWKWLPIIWKDRNYDYSYIYTILEHKLKLQSDYIGGRDIHTSAKRYSEVMMTCVRLIDKCREGYYESEYSDFHKSKHWFEEIKDEPEYSTWESKILREDFQDYFDMYPLIYKRVMKGEGPFDFDGEDDLEIKFRIAMNIGHINQERAQKLLFKIMGENIQKWWD